ncbi:glycosyltransferase family 2 protein [Flavobacteriaceae bacterium XHP0103]|uniref:glycosyltransferase family 2 protein n=1 Tax=Marixanthotalea marina TaxID=2844359 RepID=UPI002989F248|nr:glycosyltransferase family 2 protein [Marixanthotalea marina]MBU3821173.1 glycosyltransferase family 2 protein [Marixanthotalea marina]
MTPFFSVVIPLYNKENYIEDTLKSVLNQTFQDFEVVIVNDGSTDKSLEKVEKIKDDRIKVIENKKNKGLPETRNVGISYAEGIIIALLDADDIWLPNYLINIKKLHIKFPKASIYATDYCQKYSKKNILEPKKNISIQLKDSFFLIDDIFKANMHQPIFSQSSLAFKKSIVKEYTVFNPSITYAEDIDFYIRYCSKYITAYYFKACAIVNCNVPNQITKNKISKKRLPNLDSYEHLAINNSSLKKFLDFYRYIFSYHYKLEKNTEKQKELLKNINYKNLTLKQLILIKSPRIISVFFNKFKQYLLKKNIKISSY